ncbi:MAG: hypothetical protein ACK40O_09330 [Allosphingosinicella sp.]
MDNGADMLAPVTLSEAERYVPASFGLPRMRDFHERWFGDSLRSLGEPNLSRRENREGFRRRIRLLVLLNSHVWAIRIDNSADGAATVRAVQNLGPRSPRIVAQERYELAPERLRRIEDAITAAGLRTMAPDGPPMEACVDGIQFVVELNEASGVYFVSRDGCQASEPFRDLVGELNGLRRSAGFDLDRRSYGP